MNVLAIETATPACAIALRVGDDVESIVLDTERRHTESLAPGIDAALRARGLGPARLDRVVVDRGPGLYTGLRVGLATADALARATGADLVAVTSCECLAHAAHAAGVRGTLVALVDARRGEVFAQRFDLGERVEATTEPSVARPEELAALLAGATATGDGARRYAGVVAAAGGAVFDDVVPSPAVATELGRLREPVAVAVPLYLREADAVANFATRGRR